MIRYNLFEPEEKGCYNAVEVGSFWSNFILDMKVREKKHYQLKNISIKLDRT